MPFLGTTPTQGFVGANPKQSFTANGSTTVFTLTNPVASANDLEVFVGNVRQEPTAAYTAAGTTLTMSEAPASGLNFYVINKSQAQVTTTPPVNSISTDKILDSAISLSGSKVTGTLPVANGGTALTSGFINGGTVAGNAISISGSASTTFTGIPTTARQVRFVFHGVTPGNTELEVRVGNSSGILTSSVYFSHASYIYNSSSYVHITYGNAQTKMRPTPGWSNDNNTFYGYYDFFKGSTISSNNHVHTDSTFWNSGYTAYAQFTASGFVNMGATIFDRVQFLTSDGSDFHEGYITMIYI